MHTTTTTAKKKLYIRQIMCEGDKRKDKKENGKKIPQSWKSKKKY
jgi:hypothetical protein